VLTRPCRGGLSFQRSPRNPRGLPISLGVWTRPADRWHTPCKASGDFDSTMKTETDTHSVAELTAADFDATIRDGVTLVDFWAPWCGPCRMQIPVLEQVASRLGSRARVAKVNVDQYPELAGRFQITGIPTLLLFKAGRLVREFVGLQSAPALVAALEEVS
jgi:thioredoxin 1